MRATTEDKPRVLYVDDEAVMLSVLTWMLGSDFQVMTADSGEAALRLLGDSEDVHVVISDHQMPGMSGAQFLAAVREAYPLMVRILLTGERDLLEVVAAMNQAGAFRFLLKPCTQPVLLDTLQAAVAQYQLQSAEQELLHKTLVGSMQALADVLAMASPLAFGRVGRIRELALAVAKQLGLVEQWPLEFAAVAAQLGHIVLPERTLRKLYAGADFLPEESLQVLRAAKVPERIIARIPRLGPVTNILAELAATPKAGTAPAEGSLEAEILRVASAYEVAERITASRAAAFRRLGDMLGHVRPEVMGALTDVLGFEPSVEEVTEVPVGRLAVGMVLADDVYMSTGALLVPKGYRASENLIARLRNFNRDVLPAVVSVRRSSIAAPRNQGSAPEPE